MQLHQRPKNFAFSQMPKNILILPHFAMNTHKKLFYDILEFYFKKKLIYLCYCIGDCRVHASCPFSVEDGALNCHYRLNCGSILHTNKQDCTIHGSHYTKQINLLIPANTKSKVRKENPGKNIKKIQTKKPPRQNDFDSLLKF